MLAFCCFVPGQTFTDEHTHIYPFLFEFVRVNEKTMTTFSDPPRFIITPAVLRVVAAIDEFKGGWAALGDLPPERLDELEQRAVCRAVAAGIRLGGGAISDQQVESVLAGEVASARFGVTDNIAGYAKVLRLLTTSFASIPFTEHHLKQFHRVLATPGGGGNRGEFRHEDGGRIAGQMRQLLAWAAGAQEEEQLHPLLVVAAFVLRFQAICPFAEDNERLARLLALLLLLKSDYGFLRYHPLPAVIEEQRAGYDQWLQEGIARLRGDNVIAEPWLLSFFTVLLRQTDHVRAAVIRARRQTSRHGLEQQIIDHVRSQGQATNKLIQTATGANRNTIKVRLGKLVAEGDLVRHGSGKGSRYTLAARG